MLKKNYFIKKYEDIGISRAITFYISVIVYTERMSFQADQLKLTIGVGIK